MFKFFLLRRMRQRYVRGSRILGSGFVMSGRSFIVRFRIACMVSLDEKEVIKSLLRQVFYEDERSIFQCSEQQNYVYSNRPKSLFGRRYFRNRERAM